MKLRVYTTCIQCFWVTCIFFVYKWAFRPVCMCMQRKYRCNWSGMFHGISRRTTGRFSWIPTNMQRLSCILMGCIFMVRYKCCSCTIVFFIVFFTLTILSTAVGPAKLFLLALCVLFSFGSHNIDIYVALSPSFINIPSNVLKQKVGLTGL